MTGILLATLIFVVLSSISLLVGALTASNRVNHQLRDRLARLTEIHDLNEDSVRCGFVRFLVPVSQVAKSGRCTIFYKKWWHRFIRTEKFYFCVRSFRAIDTIHTSDEVLAISKKDAFYLSLCGAVDTTDPRMLIEPIRKGVIQPSKVFERYILDWEIKN